MQLLGSEGKKPRVLVIKHGLSRYHFPRLQGTEGLEITYCIRHLPTEAAQQLRAEKLDFERLKLGWLAWRILRRDYDLVAVNTGACLEYKVAMLACLLAGVPFAVKTDDWNGLPVRGTGFKKRLTEAFANWLSGAASFYFVPVSKAAEWLSEKGVAKERIIRYYEKSAFLASLPTARLTPEEARQAMGGKKTLFLFVGRLLKERKGCGVLLKAFERLQREDPTVGLALLGYGPYQKEMEDYCRTQGVTGVRFLPFVEHHDNALNAYYAACDVFVFPARREPTGFALVEAVACGKPVITTADVGAAYDYVRNGVNGFVVAPGDEEGLYYALKTLASSDKLRRQMGEQSRKIIKGLEAAWPSYEEALARASGNGPARGQAGRP